MKFDFLFILLFLPRSVVIVDAERRGKNMRSRFQHASIVSQATFLLSLGLQAKFASQFGVFFLVRREIFATKLK